MGFILENVCSYNPFTETVPVADMQYTITTGNYDQSVTYEKMVSGINCNYTPTILESGLGVTINGSPNTFDIRVNSNDVALLGIQTVTLRLTDDYGYHEDKSFTIEYICDPTLTVTDSYPASSNH